MKHDSLLGSSIARSRSFAHRAEGRKKGRRERKKEVSGVTFHLRAAGEATLLSNAHERATRRGRDFGFGVVKLPMGWMEKSARARSPSSVRSRECA